MFFVFEKDQLNIDKNKIMEKLRISEDDLDEFNEIYDECLNVARPKFLFEKKEITCMGDDYVLVEDIPIKSKIAVKNMQNTGYAYPYVVTCGKEIYDYSKSIDDFFINYWIDAIMEELLYMAMKKMNEAFKEEFSFKKTASVNPGSTADWNISGQRELFSMLKDKIEDTGITLTDSFLMLPNKSGSGVVYETKEDYMNCQDCKREKCPNRKKEFSGK